jgi:hypothetical protein
MTPNVGQPNRNLRRRLGLVLALLLVATGIGWLCCGPHRRVPGLLLKEWARHGWLVESGTRNDGWFSTGFGNVRVSLTGAPGLAIEIARLDIKHGPFGTPHVGVEGITIHLHGDPVATVVSVAKAWFSPKADLQIGHSDVIAEHRLFGHFHLSDAVLEHREDGFTIQAYRAQLGDSVWPDVRLSLQQHKSALVVGFAADGKQAIQLSCFPSERGTARWLLDVPHGPLRPLFQRLGLKLGDEFAAARGAGSVSLDIPDDLAQPVRGRVQMVVDDWPLHAPAETEPMLGRTFSLLSNVVASADGLRWELPRAELTMPVFSLVGKGSLQLGRDKRLVLEAQGERTCQQLRGLLPPGKALDGVRQFVEMKGSAAKKDRAQSAGLEIRWDTANPASPFQPAAHFVPGCGLDPWPPNP